MTKNSTIKRIISLCILISLLLTGCTLRSVPPSKESVQRRFEENYEDLQTVVNFLVSTNYVDIFIDASPSKMEVDRDGLMTYGLQEMSIEDEATVAALKHLLKEEYKSIYKIGNTIIFEQWSSIHDNGCGVAYGIVPEEELYIQYAIEIVPITDDGWHYYRYDFNEWRVNN